MFEKLNTDRDPRRQGALVVAHCLWQKPNGSCPHAKIETVPAVDPLMLGGQALAEQTALDPSTIPNVLPDPFAPSAGA